MGLVTIFKYICTYSLIKLRQYMRRVPSVSRILNELKLCFKNQTQNHFFIFEIWNLNSKSTIYYLLSTIYYLQSTIYYLLSTIYYLLSTIYYPLSTIYYLLSTIYLGVVTVLVLLWRRRPGLTAMASSLTRQPQGYPGCRLGS